jgi:hypothetical protein
MAYVGKYTDSGSQNTFYKVVGKGYGFKSFPNKSLATFAHAVQSHLAPLTAPKVYSPVCRIRVPNYFATSDGNGGIKPVTKMILSDWGYLTEIAKPYRCDSEDCCGDCSNDDLCANYYAIHDLLDDMSDNGIDYIDAHEKNLGYVKRGKNKVLVAIDFGRESLHPHDDSDWPDVCWDGAEGMECCCEQCVAKYGEVDYV